MVKILINDGIHPDGLLLLEEASYLVDTQKIPQEQLASKIGEYHVLIVRSATKVDKAIIDAGKKLKIIARGGVGLDNIDVAYAESKGIKVFNTPAASSKAVAELTFGHIFSLARMLQRSHKEFNNPSDFKKLKKAYEAGFQVRGKTLGVIGFGRIGQEVARIALGLGMRIVANDPRVNEAELSIQPYSYPDLKLVVRVETKPLAEVLQHSDFITLHVPGTGEPLIGANEIAQMKDGAFLINTARGGLIDEKALLEAVDSGKLGGAGIDVFENEPTPRVELLKHPKISCTPHIGASTVEAQSYIGMELADRILNFFGDDV